MHAHTCIKLLRNRFITRKKNAHDVNKTLNMNVLFTFLLRFSIANHYYYYYYIIIIIIIDNNNNNNNNNNNFLSSLI